MKTRWGLGRGIRHGFVRVFSSIFSFSFIVGRDTLSSPSLLFLISIYRKTWFQSAWTFNSSFLLMEGGGGDEEEWRRRGGIKVFISSFGSRFILISRYSKIDADSSLIKFLCHFPKKRVQKCEATATNLTRNYWLEQADLKIFQSHWDFKLIRKGSLGNQRAQMKQMGIRTNLQQAIISDGSANCRPCLMVNKSSPSRF